ncbi:hypothetical protein NVV99_25585 [Rhodococcus sp. PAE-6]|nr:hypothetical protein [Rhodococcus sp. PAE-6]
MVFTEHFDFDDAWRTTPEDLMSHQQGMLDPDGYLRPPPLDVAGYRESIDRCRHRFPDLTILAGVEFGQPHLFGRRASMLVDVSLSIGSTVLFTLSRSVTTATSPTPCSGCGPPTT